MSNSVKTDNQADTSPDDKLSVVNQLNNDTSEKDLTSKKEELPEDVLTETDDYSATVQRRETLEHDDILAKQVAHYISREQRRKLDFQIEKLYDRVSKELIDNPKDVIFALEKLKKAQGIVMEDMREYEEALYWVAQVKKMLVTRHNMKRWSYTWGMFALFYALIWFVVFIVGFFVDINNLGIDNLGGWYAALAGGIGGVAAILTNLSFQVSVRQEFNRQLLMKYLVQPIMGFILGAVIFFIVSTGFLVVSSSDTPGTTILIIQMLLGFIAGLSQDVVYKLIDSIVQRLSPRTEQEKNLSNNNSKDDIESLETVQKPASS